MVVLCKSVHPISRGKRGRAIWRFVALARKHMVTRHTHKHAGARALADSLTPPSIFKIVFTKQTRGNMNRLMDVINGLLRGAALGREVCNPQ